MSTVSDLGTSDFHLRRTQWAQPEEVRVGSPQASRTMEARKVDVGRSPTQEAAVTGPLPLGLLHLALAKHKSHSDKGSRAPRLGARGSSTALAFSGTLQVCLQGRPEPGQKARAEQHHQPPQPSGKKGLLDSLLLHHRPQSRTGRLEGTTKNHRKAEPAPLRSSGYTGPTGAVDKRQTESG
jgi:hypothetical protein